MNLFDIVNDISHLKNNTIVDPEWNKNYVPFVINRNFAKFPDTLAQANMMNMYHHLDKDMQYYFYINSVSKRKRFAKSHKKEKDNVLPIIQKHFNCNYRIALDIIKTLTPGEIDRIVHEYTVGRE